jgi:O-antigen/teichoic acid export membrane protein
MGAIAAMAILKSVTANWMLLAQGTATFGVAFVLLARMGLVRSLPWRESTSLLRSFLKGHQRFIIGYFVVLAVFPNVQAVVLKAASSDFELATYGAAFRYYMVLLLPLAAAHVVLLPSLQAASTAEEVKRLFRVHAQAALVFALGMIAVGVICQWVIPWIDGGSYPGAVLSFRVLCASATVSFALSPYVNVLLVRNDHRFLFGALTLSLLANIACSWWLVRTAGAAGAASATLLAAGLFHAVAALRARRPARATA